MLNASTQALCDRLLQARAQVTPIYPSEADRAAVPDDETACALQHAQGVALGAWGEAELPRYWKSGGPARDARLVHAPLLPAGVFSAAEGQVADLRAWPMITPRMEAEIALRLGQPVSPALAATLTPETVEPLVDALALSVEIVDSRWAADAQLTPPLQLADFQVHGALVLGPWQDWARHGAGRDWSAQRGQQWMGDAPAQSFVGTHSLGGPLWGVAAWLRHLTRHGQTVPAGTVVTTGTWSGCRPVARGQQLRIAFEGLGELALVI
jgi:2-keto-4-pentenoate hydratase